MQGGTTVGPCRDGEEAATAQGRKPSEGGKRVRDAGKGREPRPRRGLTECASQASKDKEAFTIEELGITDPRDRPPESNGWDGLTALVPALLLNGKS